MQEPTPIDRATCARLLHAYADSRNGQADVQFDADVAMVMRASAADFKLAAMELDGTGSGCPRRVCDSIGNHAKAWLAMANDTSDGALRGRYMGRSHLFSECHRHLCGNG
jgi:hypothetical protein